MTRAALRGDGTDNSPTGILNQPGVTVTPVGGDIDWSDLANAVRDIANHNATANAYLTAPRTRTALEFQREGVETGPYLAPPQSVAELSRYTTTAIPVDLGDEDDETEVYVGDFSSLLIGLRVGLQIEPLRERFADNGQVAWLAWMRLDVQLEQPKGFVALTGLTN